jgi:hypothetical protein
VRAGGVVRIRWALLDRKVRRMLAKALCCSMLLFVVLALAGLAIRRRRGL